MGYILKFRSPNLYTICSRKNKGFFYEKKGGKVSLFLWVCYHSSKLNLTTIRKGPANEVVVELLSFLVVWISDTVNMVLFFQFELKMTVSAPLTKEKIYEVNDFQYFFKKSQFDFDIFTKRVSFPVKYEKAIFQRSRRLKSQNFRLGVNHGHHTDFS